MFLHAIPAQPTIRPPRYVAVHVCISSMFRIVMCPKLASQEFVRQTVVYLKPKIGFPGCCQMNLSATCVRKIVRGQRKRRSRSTI